MRAASLRFDIAIEQRSGTKDPVYNEDIVAWTVFVECPADVEAKRGREFFQDNQRFPEILTRFKVRYEDADGVTPDMRIVFNSAIFNIKAVLPDLSSRRWIWIDATTGTGTS